MKFVEKLKNKVFKVADKIAGFPSIKRLKIELLLLAYMVVGGLGISIYSFITKSYIRGVMYSIIAVSGTVMFLNRSLMFKKVKFLNHFSSGFSMEKVKEVKNEKRT